MNIYQMMRGFRRSFPMQLLLMHLKSNLLLLSLWGILGMFISGMLGRRNGMHYLFLDPEYQGHVGFWSFFMVGFSFCGFLVAWQTASYILNSHRFPFLASLSRPYTKFCINNSLVPILFIGFYLWNIIHFQWKNEFVPEYGIVFDCAGFLLGILAALFLSGIYFGFTNHDILSLRKTDPLNVRRNFLQLLRRREPSEPRHVDFHKWAWPVEYYFTESLKVRLVRNVEHYENRSLERVFRQNHTNALIIQIVGITMLMVLGLFMDHRLVRIPASASMFILFSVITTLLGAMTYWAREWRAFILVGILLVANYLTQNGHFSYENRAYGLDYQHPAFYSENSTDSIGTVANFQADADSTLLILKKWRAKFSGNVFRKPKLVVVCATGGGLRAASWAVNVMQQADSVLNGKLFPHTVLMTGASGGMLGLGYLREAYLREKTEKGLRVGDPLHFERVSKDLTNAVAFAILVNDLFFPWTTFSCNKQEYYKDRGYIFEQQFNENCGGILDKTVGDYLEPEKKALVPMMMLTPVVINDGRQLLISPQRTAYMTKPIVGFERPSLAACDVVDFRRFFEKQGAMSMRFLSALRMNATYPYILPNVYLPTMPKVQVMDAGFRDNFGTKTAYRFLCVFAEWIRRNTDGVVIVDIRGTESETDLSKSDREGVVDKFLNPMGTVGKFCDLQDYTHDDYISHLQDLLGERKVDVVKFMYQKSLISERASMSLHLTTREKLDIKYAMNLPDNQQALRKLKKLVK